MKIAYVLDSYFPTQKAYGVTTENTLKSLLELGHSVTLFCYKPEIQFGNSVEGIETVHFETSILTRFFRNRALKSFGLISKVAWNISWILTIFENRNKFRLDKFEFIWTRELPLPKYLRTEFTGKSIIEIHNHIGNRKLHALKKENPEKILLCPISATLEEEVRQEVPSPKSHLSPMGINLKPSAISEIESEVRNHYARRVVPTKIGYFGKLAPNGISKGFEDVLDLALFLEERKFRFILQFVGVSNSEVPMLEREIAARDLSRNTIEIVSHLSQDRAFSMMKECDYLVLPANRDPSYAGFPLKALEYVAALRVILAGDSKINRDVFDGLYQPLWYTRDNLAKLADSIMRPMDLETLVPDMIESYEFSTKFTWLERTRSILKAAN